MADGPGRMAGHDSGTRRVAIDVGAGGCARRDKPVVVPPNVLELLLNAEEAPHRSPFVWVREVDDEGAVIQGLERGAVEYLAKPFSPRDLVSVVRLVAEDLDARGRDAYRRQIIRRRKQFMQPLHRLFPSKEEDELDDQ